jgi:dienelactone hydrolase
MEQVRIPYRPASVAQVPQQETSLPGYFFKVDNSGKPRPLLIFNNGSDGSLSFAWTCGIAPALERGYNCLTFYGPGQGLALVDQGLYFRPDWEQVITPVVDYALSREEVDPARIALMGGSQAGYWVPRALAFEHRIAAGIADPGVWDVSTSWGLAKFPPPLLQLFKSGNKAAFDQALQTGLATEPAAAATLAFRSRPFGFNSAFDTYTAIQQYALTNDIVNQIACPMLVASPEGEQFWPGQSQQLYEALPGQKELVPFTRAEGADMHCEPKAPGLRAQRMFDWLDATLA